MPNNTKKTNVKAKKTKKKLNTGKSNLDIQNNTTITWAYNEKTNNNPLGVKSKQTSEDAENPTTLDTVDIANAPVDVEVAIADVEGIGSAVATLYTIYNTEKYIKNLPKNLKQIIANIDQKDLLQYFKNIKDPTQITEQHIQNYCINKLRNPMAVKVAETGIDATSSIASTVFAFGLLFPPIIPAVGIAALAIAGGGLIATGIAAILQRIRIKRVIEKIIKDEDKDGAIKNALSKQLAIFKSSKVNKKILFNDKTNSTDNNKSFLDKAIYWLTHIISAIKIIETLKHVVPLIGRITAVGAIFVNTVKSVFDVSKNYKDRQKDFQNIPLFMQKAINEKLHITRKKYFLWGKSPLDEYKEYLKTTGQNPENIELSKLKQDALKYTLKKQFEAYSIKKKQQGSFVYSPDKDLFKKFIQDMLLDSVSKDVRNSGASNTIKLSLFFSGGVSMIFPPVAILTAAGVLLGGIIVTPIMRMIERKKCLNHIHKQDSNITKFTDNLYQITQSTPDHAIVEPQLTKQIKLAVKQPSIPKNKSGILWSLRNLISKDKKPENKEAIHTEPSKKIKKID
ncbi:MAG: hypothetical protein ABSA84_02265 [Gammaproteobacteria bacterium]|jgi:hypothetical protein